MTPTPQPKALTEQQLQTLRNLGNEAEQAADEIEALRNGLALVQQHHATAWNRGHAAGLRAARDNIKQANEAVQRDAWGNSQLTEALLAAESERDSLRAEVEREREARKAAQIRQAELTDEVVRLEPMRQRADDIKRLTADVERLRADSERMDWLSDVALGMDAVADPDNFTVVFFGTDPCKRAYGRTLRIAVDNAREAK